MYWFNCFYDEIFVLDMLMDYERFVICDYEGELFEFFILIELK